MRLSGLISGGGWVRKTAEAIYCHDGHVKARGAGWVSQANWYITLVAMPELRHAGEKIRRVRAARKSNGDTEVKEGKSKTDYT